MSKIPPSFPIITVLLDAKRLLHQDLALCCSKALAQEGVTWCCPLTDCAPDPAVLVALSPRGGHPRCRSGSCHPRKMQFLTLHGGQASMSPKINTTSKSSIEETGNSPGLTHCGFQTARDVSRLAWCNRKLQVWLNQHWGKHASVANAISLLAQAQGTGCARWYVSSTLRWVQISPFPSCHPFCKSS